VKQSIVLALELCQLNVPSPSKVITLRN